MTYAVLQGFDTSVFEPSTLTPLQLCNQLKHHYDYLMIAVATQKFKWDSVDYHYLASGYCDYIDFALGNVIVRKKYTYTGSKMTSQSNWILGVPPVPTEWQYVHGQTYNYDNDGRISSITDKTQ